MIEHLLKNKEQIIKKMEKINGLSYNINEYWIEDNFDKPIEMSFAGGDGSYNHIDYISFSFFGVGAVSFRHKIGEKIKKTKDTYIFDISHPLDIETKLRTYMLTLELKTALYTLKNYDIDYYIIDGSLFSLLIFAKTNIDKADKNKFDSIYKEYKKELDKKIDEELKSGEIGIISKDLELDREDKLLVEHAEYMVTLTKLLKEFKDKLIGISKTSKINIYFNAEIPDIAVFTKFTNKEGYSTPINFIKMLGKKKGEGHSQLSSVMKGINFINEYNGNIETAYIQFVRLEDNCGVVGITSFNKIDKDVLSSLKEISVNGYPYILKKSHETVEITNKKLQSIAKMLNIDDPIARHILGKKKKF
ncbi:DNA double-strand break repair nuclease NurA [Methanocaldococcus fervens]|uniref:NurA domain protein n=1 Tax=Methanocaldococcus fervens (strain DSM 4213 / JCM 15782 / AG86) TaxID=573064 RepID=C7P5P8_METFA|nr:DNA double-strand break repair nuclease NurA [Methanocaldococcus fervens]ACV23880.1 NurA domain protein [Methanocaldococcus fervens AG86]